MVYINTPRGREEAEAALQTELVIGGFLCAIGYGVMILGAWLFMRSWSEAGVAEAVWNLVFGGVVLALFYLARAFELRRDLRRRMPPSGPRPPRTDADTLALMALMIAPLLFVFAVTAFWGQARREAKAPETTQFALTLPAIEASPTEEVLVVDAGPKVASPAKQPIQPAAVLVWNVKDYKEAVPAGAPPIILGGFLVIGFGVFFPSVKLSESKDLVETTQKLVAPILSAALVWFGAHQQSDADHVAANEYLAEKGLPPVIEVPGGPVRPETIREMSPQGLDYIGNAIDGLDRRLSGVSNNVDLVIDDVNAVSNSTNDLQARLNLLQAGLGNLARPPDASVAELTNAVNDVRSRVVSIDGGVAKTYAVANTTLGIANTGVTQTKAALVNTKNILSEVAADMQSVCAQTQPVLAQLTTQARAAADAENAYAAKWHFSTLLAGIGWRPDQKYGQLRAAHDAVSETLAQVAGIRKAARCDPRAKSSDLRLASDVAAAPPP